MKKVVLAALIFAATGLSACKKDEVATPEKQATVKAKGTVESKCRNCGHGGWD